MNEATKKMIYIVLVTVSGPLLAALARAFHMTPDDVKSWADVLTAVTTAVGLAWGLSAFSNQSIAKDTAHIPGVQVHVDPTSAPSKVIDLLRSNDPSLNDVVPMALDKNGVAQPVDKANGH